MPTEWVFFIPAILLGVVTATVGVVAKNTPGEAGYADFDTLDASSGDDGPAESAVAKSTPGAAVLRSSVSFPSSVCAPPTGLAHTSR